ncbi:MAG: hypothetical protein CMI54_08580 [Parcubacteria group bacterium]|nr:hypothetical protein [Parcubacteria group bacterium]|tara:strand:- start:9799 stop:10224 length:426 start_codon:yes stop_codon:yes gene_type:complete
MVEDDVADVSYGDESEPPAPEQDIYDAENGLEFQQNLIAPKSESTFDWLNRDAVLGNIDPKEKMEIRAGLELVQLLDHLGSTKAKNAFLSDINTILVVSRSVEGFERKMMQTAISELKGVKLSEMEGRTVRKFFGGKKRRY